jgi:hypothetical protein
MTFRADWKLSTRMREKLFRIRETEQEMRPVLKDFKTAGMKCFHNFRMLTRKNKKTFHCRMDLKHRRMFSTDPRLNRHRNSRSRGLDSVNQVPLSLTHQPQETLLIQIRKSPFKSSSTPRHTVAS